MVLLTLFICLGAGLGAAIQEKPYGTSERYAREERADSLTGFDITKYEITLNINTQTHFIQGDVKAHVTSESNLTALDYNLVGLTVSEVRVNNVPMGYTFTGGIIHIPVNFTQGQSFTTQVFYSGVPTLSPDVYHIGMIFSNNMVFTISDPDASRYWWPCYDHPWDKALVDLHITLRSDWLVACNGLRDSIVDNGNGTKTHHWLGSNPMMTYLVCVTAGPYVEINQTAGTLPIKNFVFQNQFNAAQTDFATLPNIIEYYSSVFGPYPFEKYGNAVVNMTTYGAMEHQTMTTLGSQYITGNHSGELVIAHELSHQWFGNCLTPLTFKDVWLSEGFATYSEMLWKDKSAGWTAAWNYVRDSYHQYYINYENITGPQIIYNPDFGDIFSPPSYEKAASVLHMLRLKIGEQHFFQLLQTWFSTYHNGNVITAEFEAMAESISGMDLTQFFQQWIFQAGIPTVSYWTLVNPATWQVKIVAQSTCTTQTQFQLDIPISIPRGAEADSCTIQVNPAGYVNLFNLTIGADCEQIDWDPHHWVLARAHNTPRLVLNSPLAGTQSVLLDWNAFTCPLPLAQIRIWRKLSTETAWTLAGTAAFSERVFTDTGVQPGNTYNYQITAADGSGFETLPSNQVTVTPLIFNFDLGMLLVDETRDGNGMGLNPSDAMVDDFYAGVLQGLNYSTWDCVTMGLPTLSTLCHYNLVVWHADDFSQNQIGSCLADLSSYLLGGGKLVISGWKTPSVFTTGFINGFMGAVSLVYDNNSALISAQSDVYPALIPDEDKLPGSWNGILNMVYTFQGNGTALYTAQMNTGCNGNGLPVVVRYDEPGVLIVCGFPLYYMQPEGVHDLLQTLLPSLFPGVGTEDESAASPAEILQVYPNPASSQLWIKAPHQTGTAAQVHIYNLKGQWIASLQPAESKEGKDTYYWEGKATKGKQAPAGLYLVKWQQGSQRLTRKVVLLY